MKVKGSIIITDPCYVVKDEEWDGLDTDLHELGFTKVICEDTIYGDWSCSTYKTTQNPQELAEKLATINKQFDEAYEELGGDEISDNDYELIDNKYEDEVYAITKGLQYIGSFCADAGMVCVLLLDEVLKYNPDFEEEYIIGRPWCVTLIEDFDGDVRYFVDDDENAHILGTGNINFFTTQTGL